MPVVYKAAILGRNRRSCKRAGASHSMMKSTNDRWASDAGEIIEIITSPNNPDGRINVPTTTTTKTIYDSVYDWPSFLAQVIAVRKTLQSKFFRSPNWLDTLLLALAGL